jgi:hypothetical protein
MTFSAFHAFFLTSVLAVVPSPAPNATPASSPAPGTLTQFVPSDATFKADIDREINVLPTPPPDVLAKAQYVYEEKLTELKRWWFLPLSPEERYVQMYVTSVRHVGPLVVCRGWALRVPMSGAPIVETDVTYICMGRLRPIAKSMPSTQ